MVGELVEVGAQRGLALERPAALLVRAGAERGLGQLPAARGARAVGLARAHRALRDVLRVALRRHLRVPAALGPHRPAAAARLRARAAARARGQLRRAAVDWAIPRRRRGC